MTTFQLAMRILDGIAPEYKSEFFSEEVASSTSDENVSSADESLTSDEESTGATTGTTSHRVFLRREVNMQ